MHSGLNFQSLVIEPLFAKRLGPRSLCEKRNQNFKDRGVNLTFFGQSLIFKVVNF